MKNHQPPKFSSFILQVIFSFCFFTAVPSFSWAYDLLSVTRESTLQKGQTLYVEDLRLDDSDSIIVRDAPAQSAHLLAELNQGAFVILEFAQEETINGIRAPWLKVRIHPNYNKNHYEGFVWLGAIAENVWFAEESNQAFVLELSYDEKQECVQYILKYIDKGQEAASVAACSGNVQVERFWLTHLPDNSLINLTDVFRIDVQKSAYDTSNIYAYYGWNGQSFHFLGSAKQYSDDCDSYNESIVLPTSNERLNLILKMIHESRTVNSICEDRVEKEAFGTEMYQWNGDEIIPLLDNSQHIDKAYFEAF